MNIVFRTDSSVQIGTGHVMRCLTLADELRQHGATVSFICSELRGNSIDLIECRNYKNYRLPYSLQGGSDDRHVKLHWEIDAEQTGAILKREKEIDWLVVDHYGINERWELCVAGHVKKPVYLTYAEKVI